jgi:hypothetical protein
VDGAEEFQIDHVVKSMAHEYTQPALQILPRQVLTFRVDEDDSAGVYFSPVQYTTTAHDGVVTGKYHVGLNSQPLHPVNVTMEYDPDLVLVSSAAVLMFNPATWHQQLEVSFSHHPGATPHQLRRATIRHLSASADTHYGSSSLTFAQGRSIQAFQRPEAAGRSQLQEDGGGSTKPNGVSTPSKSKAGAA